MSTRTLIHTQNQSTEYILNFLFCPIHSGGGGDGDTSKVSVLTATAQEKVKLTFFFGCMLSCADWNAN